MTTQEERLLAVQTVSYAAGVADTEARFQRLLTKTYCAYCGKEYDTGDAETAKRAVSEHIYTCEKHPMQALKIRYDKAVQVLADFLKLVKRGETILAELEIFYIEEPTP